MIGKGFTVQFVADYFNVAESTLYRNYSEALRKGYAFRNGCLQAKQFKAAMVDNNVTMQIWLGKQWLDQRDMREVKATVNGRIEHALFDPAKLSESELAEVERILQSADAGSGSE